VKVTDALRRADLVSGGAIEEGGRSGDYLVTTLRPATTIALVLLLLLIVAAAIVQFVLMAH
jgi:hypothetical protein